VHKLILLLLEILYIAIGGNILSFLLSDLIINMIILEVA